MTVRRGFLALIPILLFLAGCGSRLARVTGNVTCQGKPVAGSILFSPKGENAGNQGPAVSAPIQVNGGYALQLTSLGKHIVIITPRDLKYPVKHGEQDFPCARSATEWDVQAGDNHIEIEMTSRGP